MGSLTLEQFYVVLVALAVVGFVAVLVTTFISLRWAKIILYIVVSLIMAFVVIGDNADLFPSQLVQQGRRNIFVLAYAMTSFNVLFWPFWFPIRWLLGLPLLGGNDETDL